MSNQTTNTKKGFEYYIIQSLNRKNFSNQDIKEFYTQEEKNQMIANIDTEITNIENEIDKIKFKKLEIKDILTKIEEFEKNNYKLSEQVEKQINDTIRKNYEISGEDRERIIKIFENKDELSPESQNKIINILEENYQISDEDKKEITNIFQNENNNLKENYKLSSLTITKIKFDQNLSDNAKNKILNILEGINKILYEKKEIDYDEIHKEYSKTNIRYFLKKDDKGEYPYIERIKKLTNKETFEIKDDDNLVRFTNQLNIAQDEINDNFTKVKKTLKTYIDQLLIQNLTNSIFDLYQNNEITKENQEKINKLKKEKLKLESRKTLLQFGSVAYIDKNNETKYFSKDDFSQIYIDNTNLEKSTIDKIEEKPEIKFIDKEYLNDYFDKIFEDYNNFFLLKKNSLSQNNETLAELQSLKNDNVELSKKIDQLKKRSELLEFGTVFYKDENNEIKSFSISDFILIYLNNTNYGLEEVRKILEERKFIYSEDIINKIEKELKITFIEEKEYLINFVNKFVDSHKFSFFFERSYDFNELNKDLDKDKINKLIMSIYLLLSSSKRDKNIKEELIEFILDTLSSQIQNNILYYREFLFHYMGYKKMGHQIFFHEVKKIFNEPWMSSFKNFVPENILNNLEANRTEEELIFIEDFGKDILMNYKNNYEKTTIISLYNMQTYCMIFSNINKEKFNLIQGLIENKDFVTMNSEGQITKETPREYNSMLLLAYSSLCDQETLEKKNNKFSNIKNTISSKNLNAKTYILLILKFIYISFFNLQDKANKSFIEENFFESLINASDEKIELLFDLNERIKLSNIKYKQKDKYDLMYNLSNTILDQNFDLKKFNQETEGKNNDEKILYLNLPSNNLTNHSLNSEEQTTDKGNS